MRTTGLILTITLLTGCTSLEESRVESPHYKDGRFQNLYNDDAIAGKSFFTVMRWKMFGPRDEPAVKNLPEKKIKAYQIAPQDLYARSDGVKITWIGHATALITIRKGDKDTVLITDPVFKGIPFKARQVKLPLAKEKLPKVDYVIISHAHFDHTDSESLLFLQEQNKDIVYIFPEGFAAWARDLGLNNIATLAWWKNRQTDLAKVHALPAHHWGMRSVNDRMQFHWASFVIETGYGDIYFAGDTGWSDHFATIAKKFPKGFEAALMPIGAYSPRWFMKSAHINPPEAIRANKVLNSRQLLPIHWGTFELADEDITEPIYYLQAELQKLPQPAMLWRPGVSYEFGVKSLTPPRAVVQADSKKSRAN